MHLASVFSLALWTNFDVWSLMRDLWSPWQLFPFAPSFPNTENEFPCLELKQKNNVSPYSSFHLCALCLFPDFQNLCKMTWLGRDLLNWILLVVPCSSHLRLKWSRVLLEWRLSTLKGILWVLKDGALWIFCLTILFEVVGCLLPVPW